MRQMQRFFYGTEGRTNSEQDILRGKLIYSLSLLFLVSGLALAQEPVTQPPHLDVQSGDLTRTLLGAVPSRSPADSIVETRERRNALGLDLLLSNSGFGLGAFYRRQYTDDLYGFGTFSISEVKDDREVEQYDIVTGETIVPGKINRFLLLPLIFGVQDRLFREDITDNFRPYITAAVGPTLVYSAPYNREFFNSLGHGQAHYTVGGYVGFGAFFGLDPSSLVGVSFRYYFVPLKDQIESLEGQYMRQFGGFFITINVGTMY
jgi:hypothetical protein